MKESPSDRRSLGDCGLRLLCSLLRVRVLQLLAERFGKFTSPLFPETRVGRIQVATFTRISGCRKGTLLPPERIELLVLYASFHEDVQNISPISLHSESDVSGRLAEFLIPLTGPSRRLLPFTCCWLEILLCALCAPR